MAALRLSCRNWDSIPPACQNGGRVVHGLEAANSDVSFTDPPLPAVRKSNIVRQFSACKSIVNYSTN